MLRIFLALVLFGFFAFIAAVVAVVGGFAPMQTVLAWAGVIALSLFGLVLLAVLILFLRLRAAWRTMKATIGDMEGSQLLESAFGNFRAQPATITPRRRADHDWGPAGAEAVAWLKASDFQPAGTWGASEVEDMVVAGWVRADGAVVALCSLGEKVPFWIDVTGEFPDANTLTVTNSIGSPAQPPPWKERERLDAGTGLAELVATFERLRAGRALKPMTTDSFAAVLAEAYARDVEWQALRGFDEDAIRQAAQAGGQEAPGEGALMMMRRQHHYWAVDVLSERMKARLIEASGLSAGQWAKVAETSVVVIDRMTGQEAAGKLPSARGDDDDAADDVAGIPVDPFSCLAWHNGRATQDRRLRVAARIDQPLRAELWVPVA